MPNARTVRLPKYTISKQCTNLRANILTITYADINSQQRSLQRYDNSELMQALCGAIIRPVDVRSNSVPIYSQADEDERHDRAFVYTKYI